MRRWMNRQGGLAMTTATWTGAFSTDYYDPDNWMSGFAPGNFDTATFGPATNTVVTVASDGSALVGAAGWQFTGGNYRIIINSNGQFFLAGGVQVTGGSATIEVGNSTQILFVGGDGGTAAWVLDPHGFLGFTGTGPIHLGSLAGDSTSGIA